jgi:hypothetical protein
VDNPEDLQQILARPGETRTQQLLRQWARHGILSSDEPETA